MKTLREDKPQRRSQAERRETTRNKLILATIECICDVGYANITTSDIAHRAGVTRGALQHHFGKRVDLLMAVVDHLSTEMLRLTKDLPSNRLSIEDRISTITQQYWAIFTSPTFLAVLNIFLGIQDDREMYGTLRTHMARVYSTNDGLWEALFSDLGLPRERLITIRRVLLAALRGLGVAQIMGLQSRTVRHELQLVEEMLRSALMDGRPVINIQSRM